MNKNFNLFFSIFLIGIFALLFLRTQIFGAYSCQNVPGYTQSQCTFTEGGSRAGWHCTSSQTQRTTCDTEVTRIPCGGTQCPCSWDTLEYCHFDECGYPIEPKCTRHHTRTNCDHYVSTHCQIISITPRPTACACYKCTLLPTPTPCNRCLSKAPKSCQCLELKPKKDSANNLSFECLVKGSKDAQITNYTVSFKSPSAKIINLKANKITQAQCPASVTQNSTCYQVETTAITAPEKGKYEMVVPPQIICQ